MRTAIWLAILPCWLLGSAGPAAALTAGELEGTWYVLVHYRDSQTAHPDAWRWEDRIWMFEREGDALSWTEYPIVVFSGSDGRFESLGGNRASRVLEAWEPNEAQLADISTGLEVNPRGSKSKRLELDGDRWVSSGTPIAASASVITYIEEWSIDDVDTAPVFGHADFFGSGRTEGLEGRTLYRSESLEAAEIRGVYARDGTREGRFRMLRAGSVGTVRGSGKTQSQRAWDVMLGNAATRLSAEELEAFSVGREAGQEVPEEVRLDVRQRVRREVEASFRAQDQDPNKFRGRVERLTRQIEQQLLDEGKSVEEIQKMLRSGELNFD